jgi:hypothetical protein
MKAVEMQGKLGYVILGVIIALLAVSVLRVSVWELALTAFAAFAVFYVLKGKNDGGSKKPPERR